MTKTKSLVIENANLSLAWAEVFNALMQSGVKEIVPLQVTISGITKDGQIEIPEVRRLIDTVLEMEGLASCATVAGTIFPASMWNPELPREVLFERYRRTLPHLRKFKQNVNGIYFERLMQYGENNFNQLDFFIKSRTEKRNKRRSVLQASLVEPERDLTNQPLRGFPCLQQVSFAPFGNKELAVNGFYGTQYIYQKAYGNYLGLLNLWRFVAHELGLQLTQISCFTGIAQLGIEKSKVKELARNLETVLGDLR